MMGKSSTDEEIQTRNEIPFQEKEIKNCKPIKSKPSPVLQDHSNENVSKICRRTVATINYFSRNFHELDEKCNSMMGKTTKMSPTGQPLYRCDSWWSLAMCFFKVFLALNVFSQKLHGMEIPSKCFALMWFFKFPIIASFPQPSHLYSG